MGCSGSTVLEPPNNPLQELQYKEKQRKLRKRKWEKEQKQLAKLQKKHAKKQKKRRKWSKVEQSGSLAKSCSVAPQQDCLDQMLDENIPEDHDTQIEESTRRQLNEDLSTFLLNQISLTFQFYGNYDSEIAAISDRLLAKEHSINQHLEEHSILFSNPLDAGVAKWLQYKPLHGPAKAQLQLLQTQTMYVVFENIDIARPNDANYDSISPLCKLHLDTDFHKTTPCKEDYADMLREVKWKGYVRLKLREDPKQESKSNQTTGEVIYTDGSSSYSTNSGSSSKAPSSLSSGYGSETDYDYGYITHLNIHHPLSELKMNVQHEQCQLDAKVLPESCISKLASYVTTTEADDTDDEESEDETDNEDEGKEGSNTPHSDYETVEAIKVFKIEQERRKKLLQQRYLNSQEFMRYFGELMRQKLAEQLLIPEEELMAATYRGCSIYTKQYELIPTINVSQHWPDCAFQFKLRERSTSVHPKTGQKCQWPTRTMIKRIETFGYHVIPVGYAPKRQRNPFRELEWRIVFPKAERYLEQHLTGSQTKVFMMMKALVKTFIEPQEQHKALMFTIDYLRTHLFWECERDFSAWPEEFLGEVLVRFINSFMQRLREKRLSDFFIEERNLFECVPEYSLVTLYSILSDIATNPLMHLMVAFRNLDYAENFYPKLNFKKIFHCLTENDVLKLKNFAKRSRNLINLENTETEAALMLDEGAKGLVGMKQHREKTKGKLRRKTHLMRHDIEIKKKQDYESRRASVESIDVEFVFNKDRSKTSTKLINQGIENFRRTNILEILLDEMIEMAGKAVDMRAAHLAKLYLTQARRLCQYYHDFGCDVGAKEYLATINSIIEEVNILVGCDVDAGLMPPALPMRSSFEPVKCTEKRDMIYEVEKTYEGRYMDVAVINEPDKFEVAKEHNFAPNGERLEDVEEDESSNIYMSESESTVESVDRESCMELTGDKNLTMSESLRFKDLLNSRKSMIGRDSFRKECNEILNSDFIERGKCIKFTEHVVEVHEGDTNPIQKPQCYSPVSILRFGGSLRREEYARIDSDVDISTSKIRDERRELKDRDEITVEDIDEVKSIQRAERIKNSGESKEISIPNMEVKDTKSKIEKNSNCYSIREENESGRSYIKNIGNDFEEDRSSIDTSNSAKGSQSTESKLTKMKSMLNKIGSEAGIFIGGDIINPKLMDSITNSTEKVLSTMSVKEERAKIREMLKQKGVQLKGVFNQTVKT